MIDALIGGKVSGTPAKRTGPSGKPFVVAKVRTPTGQGETIFINVICFDEAVGDALVALSDGDSVALSGAMTPKVWTPANGEPRVVVDLIAHSITTSYHVQRKRQATLPRATTDKYSGHVAAVAPLPDSQARGML